MALRAKEYHVQLEFFIISLVVMRLDSLIPTTAFRARLRADHNASFNCRIDSPMRSVFLQGLSPLAPLPVHVDFRLCRIISFLGGPFAFLALSLQAVFLFPIKIVLIERL